MYHHVWSSFSLIMTLFSVPQWLSCWLKTTQLVICGVDIQISAYLTHHSEIYFLWFTVTQRDKQVLP